MGRRPLETGTETNGLEVCIIFDVGDTKFPTLAYGEGALLAAIDALHHVWSGREQLQQRRRD